MNVFSLLEQSARRFADRGAVYVGCEFVQSYAELQRRSLRFGSALRRRHPAASRIAIASENCAQYLELLFGTWAAGCAAVPLNFKLHPKEMVQIIEDSGSACVFVSPLLAAGLQAALAGTGAGGCEVIEIGSANYEACFDACSDATPANALAVASATALTIAHVTAPFIPARVEPQALAWLFYTSGTTGRSKGAMLTHRNLLAATLAHLADVESIDEGASLIHAAPMSHGSGMYVLPYVARGARQVIPASGTFDPEEFIELCNQHPACGAFLAPTMVQRLRLAAEATGKRGRNLRSIVYGGGPMYVQELKKSLAVFGQIFTEIYGQGEAPMTITSLRRQDHELHDDAILGSVGWARSGVEVAVVGADGQPVATGTIGEIVCRGDVVMAGYWNNLAGTLEALRGGWLYTGDMGSLDPRGYLTLRDRSKDVVISGGSNIYPREVEEALLTHPGVAEVCVVGQPDPEWGESVVAFIVAAPGAVVTDTVLDAHCLERIARFKRPKHYLFISALPKNSYGKVLKRELRQSLPTRERGVGPADCFVP
jgi:acyl-CoA synthetase (AMP-forming)/AMP-acid ligase II